jgi:hypothetical protein
MLRYDRELKDVKPTWLRENGDFAITKRGFRSFTIPQMRFVHLPLSKVPHQLEWHLSNFVPNLIFFVTASFLSHFTPEPYLFVSLVHGLFTGVRGEHGPGETETPPAQL